VLPRARYLREKLVASLPQRKLYCQLENRFYSVSTGSESLATQIEEQHDQSIPLMMTRNRSCVLPPDALSPIADSSIGGFGSARRKRDAVAVLFQPFRGFPLCLLDLFRP
jgi:hypothetical protein